MPRTKKTSATKSTTAKRGTTTKRSSTTAKRGTTAKSSSPAAKRKTATKTAAPRTKTSAGSRRTTNSKQTVPKTGSRAFKFKLLATLLVCLGIVVVAVLGTVFYDKLVPVKSPVTATKSNGTTIVTPPTQTATVKPDIKTDKTPSTDKPGDIAVTEPTQVKPDNNTETKPDETILAQNTAQTAPAKPTEPADKAIKPGGKPLMAVIFDDMGNDQPAAQKLQNLKIPLTFSILPYTTHAQAIAKNAPNHIEIMVHVPMEAINGESNNEPNALRADMTEAELAETLRKNIALIPNAKGINNHTGSKLTQQLVPMQVIMLVLKEKNMFFVDSKTSDKSVAKATAEMLLVPNTERNIFLDHVADKATIKAQLDKAVALAKKNGFAVVIGHPRPLTMEVILQELPGLTKEIEFVPVSVLTR